MCTDSDGIITYVRYCAMCTQQTKGLYQAVPYRSRAGGSGFSQKCVLRASLSHFFFVSRDVNVTVTWQPMLIAVDFPSYCIDGACVTVYKVPYIYL